MEARGHLGPDCPFRQKRGCDVVLEQELQTFQRELPALLADPTKRGKYALVHGNTVEGVYPSLDAALDAGYDRFGLEPFLVKEIIEHEEPSYFSRNITRWA
jgi:hypothetical protein